MLDSEALPLNESPCIFQGNLLLEKRIDPKKKSFLCFQKYAHKISPELLADILSVSKRTIAQWEKNGKLSPIVHPATGKKQYPLEQLLQFEAIRALIHSTWEQQQAIQPQGHFKSIELFAGAGGLALGLEQAGFHGIAFNEIDRDAAHTLKTNRPHWNIIQQDIRHLDFSTWANPGETDLLSGGFPCQAFSYAGGKLGFEDTRGTLFFEFARAIQTLQPKIFLGENVRGLLTHDRGQTLHTIQSILQDLGYILIPPRVLKAIFYRVPQKRERLFLIGIRQDLAPKVKFSWPDPYPQIFTVADAFKAGDLYNTDVPESLGQVYPDRKREILAHVPAGGYWRDLPDTLQQEYMQGSYFLTGGKTGMARRLSWDEPSLTLTCSPAQKQTERCHPEHTRPLTVREYARLQTFPDDWQFTGSLASQYKQIGNAVPVNLARAIGTSLITLCNQLSLT
jgi:DNA (cytosine-5)-methyltransferase 1